MKSLVTIIIMCTVLLTIMFSPVTIREGSGQDSRVIGVMDANTGTNAVIVGNDIDPMPEGGLSFTVNVTLTGTTDFLFTYQVAIAYNRSLVRCTGAWINKDDPAFVFRQIKDNVVIPEPEIDNDYVGYVKLGAAGLGEGQYVNVSSGLLAQINLTAIKRGDSMLKVIPTGDLEYGQYADSFLWNTEQQYISFATENLALTADCGPSAPVAAFSFQPENPTPGVEVAFDAKNSYDPYGNITLYSWDFGDDTNVENTSATSTAHTFTSLGAYSVNLTIMNDFALNPAYNYSNSILKEVQVGVLPDVNFTLEPAQPRELTEITFDASQSIATEGSIITYIWNFGDTVGNTTSSQTITHMFTKKGVYNVSLTVFDNHGLHNSITTTIQVGGIPTAAFIFSPVNPDVDQVVTFNATQSRASDAGDTIVSYVWDFGDGNITQFDASTSNAATPQYSYFEKGNYTVSLTVYDNNGLFDSNVQILIVGHESPNYTLYIAIGIVAALVVIIGVVVFQRRSKPRRHTSQPKISQE